MTITEPRDIAAKDIAMSQQGHLFRRKMTGFLPKAVSAQGVWITDEIGKTYLDAAGGCAVVNIGHGVKEVAEAIGTQALTLGYVNGTQFTHDSAESLAEALAPHLEATVKDPRCYFLMSGTDAVEASLKLARQYWVESGKLEKTIFISRSPSYHGCSLSTLSLSAREHYKIPYAPYMMHCERVLSPWGNGQDHQAVQALADTIERVGAHKIAAFIAEPISGSSTGAVVPDADYWPGIQELCHRHDILLIADEVMCGMGRTGKWLASEHFGLQADIVTLGKGLNGGYAPLSALVASGKIVNCLAEQGKNFLHAGTYSHTPVICSAGLATVRYLEEHQLVERCETMGALLHQRIQSLKRFPFIGKIHGRGLFAGVELLKDPASRTPFPRKDQFVERLVQNAFDLGLILWYNTGHVNGHDGDLIILAPPFIITEAELDQLMSRLITSLEGMEKQA